MESTGSTSSKVEKKDKKDKKENTIPKESYKFIPSIHDQSLGEKTHRKKLQALFDKYLKPQ
jgi:hypothetical protein